MTLRRILIPALVVTMIGCAPVGQHRNPNATAECGCGESFTVA